MSRLGRAELGLLVPPFEPIQPEGEGGPVTMKFIRMSPDWMKVRYIQWSLANLNSEQKAAYYNRVHRRKNNPKFKAYSDLAIRLDALAGSAKLSSGQVRMEKLWLFAFILTFVGNLYFAIHGAKLAFGEQTLQFGVSWFDAWTKGFSISFYLAIIFEVGAIALLRVKSPLGFMPLMVVIFTISYPVYDEFTAGRQVIAKSHFDAENLELLEKEASAKLFTKKSRYHTLQKRLKALPEASSEYQALSGAMVSVEQEILEYTDMIKKIDRLQLEHISTKALAALNPHTKQARGLLSKDQRFSELFTLSVAEAFMRLTLFLMSITFFAKAFPYHRAG